MFQLLAQGLIFFHLSWVREFLLAQFIASDSSHAVGFE